MQELAMFRKALAILVLGAASATGAAAHASDWNHGAVRNGHPVHVVPRYVPPARYAPPAYHGWARPAHPYWHTGYAYPRYYAHPQPHDWRANGWRHDRDDRGWHNGWRNDRDGHGNWHDNYGHNNWHDNNWHNGRHDDHRGWNNNH
jgi:hypothetical protein